jgi:hypothetical protein
MDRSTASSSRRHFPHGGAVIGYRPAHSAVCHRKGITQVALVMLLC